jgi:CubicO group peptidase (beta-lactamase class C family)
MLFNFSLKKIMLPILISSWCQFAIADEAPSVATHKSLDDKIDSLLIEQALPGLVLLIKHQGRTVHYGSYGLVNTKKSKPVKKDALFRIFSMSKPITAVAVMQLVDKGLISLNDDIRKYLPELEPFEVNGEVQTVTVHHLLTHTAGFGYGGGLKNWIDIRYLIANPLSRSNTNQEMLDDISGIDLKFIPGEKFEYSIASDIQGALIEAVTGQSIDTYLANNIFGPLNMTDTGFYVPKGEHERLVDMYEYDAGTFEQAYTFNKDKLLFVERGVDSEYLEKPTLLSAGGGLVSTAKDYSNFVTMLMNKGEFKGRHILSPSLVEKMLTSHTMGLDTHFMPRVYSGVGFGYGVGIKEIDTDIRQQGTFFWGGMGGTVFWGDPKSELQLVAMMQVEDGWIALEKWLIPQVYELFAKQKLDTANVN